MNTKSVTKIRIIIICTNVTDILNLISNKDGIELVGIVEDGPKRTISASKLKRWYFSNYLLWKLADRNFSIKVYSKINSIDYFYNSDGKEDELENWLKALSPDLVIIYSMSRLLRKSILGIPKTGLINIHPSLVPNFKGANPDFWIAYHSVQESGVTIHFVAEKADSGDIFEQKKFSIQNNLKQSAYNAIVNKIINELLDKALNRLIENDFFAEPQIHSKDLLKAPRLKSIDIFNYINPEFTTERIIHLFNLQEKLLNRNPQLKIGERFKYRILELNESKTDRFIVKGRKFNYIFASDGVVELKISRNLNHILYDLIYNLTSVH